MRIQLTPGSLRALHRAATYLSEPNGPKAIDAPSLLRALVEEPECRAAEWLEESGINAETLTDALADLGEPIDEAMPAVASSSTGTEFPQPAYADPNQVNAPRFFLDDQTARVPRLNLPLREALAVVHRQTGGPTADFPLATEHFLLILTLQPGPVGQWLREHRCDPMTIRRRLGRQYPEFVMAMGDSDLSQMEDDTDPIPMPLEPAAEEVPEAVVAPRLVEAVPEPIPERTTPRSFSVTESTALFRIFDAVSNRAAEALRVLEDHCRFVLDDRHLTGALKAMRHELRQLGASLPLEDRLHARETLRDTGTALEGSREYDRAGAGEVLVANFLRLQESLRSLEEYAKTLVPSAARRFEELRYRAYTLQKAVLGTSGAVDRFAGARLYVLIDAGKSPERFSEKVESLIAVGVDFLQLRDKSADDRTLLDRAGRLRDATRETGTRFIMNDRPDLAVLSEADGVHLGQEELSVHQARRLIGPHRLIGVSTHHLSQATQAVLDGADYIGVGPTFPSATKHFEDFPGLKLLETVAREIRLPAFAIGGIDLENLDAVLSTGIHGVAVASAIWSADDPPSSAGDFLARLRPAGEAPDPFAE